MKIKNASSLKAKIRNIANEKKIPAQAGSWPLNENTLRTIIEKICVLSIDDGIIFRLDGIAQIRDDDIYGGFRVSLSAVGEYNTRLRDFYDVFILSKTQKFDIETFRNALGATAEHRGTADKIKPHLPVLKSISESTSLKAQWKKYQNRYSYAGNITFEETVKVLEELL